MMVPRRVPGVGDTLGGYTLESLLGRGGMGSVYLATHDRLERKAALKVISPELAHDDEFRSRFLREAQLAASLDHSRSCLVQCEQRVLRFFRSGII